MALSLGIIRHICRYPGDVAIAARSIADRRVGVDAV
jgi:hypothetical protein